MQYIYLLLRQSIVELSNLKHNTENNNKLRDIIYVIKRNDSNTLLRNSFDGSRAHFVYDINSFFT